MAKIAGVHQSIIIDVTGSGGFTGGSIKVERVGNQVTISAIADLTHASLNAVSSASGLLPTWARPAVNKINLYTMTAALVRRCDISTNGAFSADYRDWAGTATVSTSTSADLTISYNV